MSDEAPLWSPSDPSSTTCARFRDHMNAAHSLSLSTYQDLYHWSVSNRGDFWSAVWDFEGVSGDKGAAPYVDEKATPSDNPLWFKGASLNWAENQLRHAKARADETALIQTQEPCAGYEPGVKRVTWRELEEAVGRVQRAMKASGVQRGDTVAFWGGTCAEAVIVLLATSSIGGIFSSAAADFGVDGVLERLTQIRPKLLFVTNGVIYGETPRPLLPLLPTLLSSLEYPPAKVVAIDHLPSQMVPVPDGIQSLERWADFAESGGSGTTTFERMGFNEPIWILFSSGTTGRPKAIVHRQGGMLIDSLREHHLAGDMGPKDVYFYYTTPGWMMFQYLVSGLATGATLVLYEGSPLKRPESLWRMVDDFGISIFGVSAKYLEQISKTYPDVGQHHKLDSLRQILSTGSPLPPGLFDFVYDNVKKDVLLGSVTGGSDICSVFAGRNTSLPVYRGEIQSRMLGFALDTIGGGEGKNDPGELICREAFPIQPIGFWPLPLPNANFDAAEIRKAQERFKESYFKDDKGLWYHGDFVRMTPSRSYNAGGLVMLGRSDGVLNPGGIRFGPTDIYSVLETDPEAGGDEAGPGKGFAALGVEETLVVGLMIDGGADEAVVLFVKMAQGKTLDEALIKRMRTAIRLARSARHVPAKILQVSDVPVTLTGKRVEVPIRKVINGAPVSSINPATLRNPECLAEYAALGETLRREARM